MPDDERPNNIEETPVLQIMSQIRDGTLDPKGISQEIRQDCVEHLWITEGQPVAVIAQLLKVSDKTIRRDKDVIRERNAKKLTPEDRLKLLNEFMDKWTASHENLQRLSRLKEGSDLPLEVVPVLKRELRPLAQEAGSLMRYAA